MYALPRNQGEHADSIRKLLLVTDGKIAKANIRSVLGSLRCLLPDIASLSGSTSVFIIRHPVCICHQARGAYGVVRMLT